MGTPRPVRYPPVLPRTVRQLSVALWILTIPHLSICCMNVHFEMYCSHFSIIWWFVKGRNCRNDYYSRPLAFANSIFKSLYADVYSVFPDTV